MRALLQLGNHLHEALLHRLLDVVAALGRLHACEPVAQDLGDRRTRAGGRGDGALEVARLQERRHLVPHAPVGALGAPQVEPALERDRGPERRDEGNGIHEDPALLEELDDRAVRIHGVTPGVSLAVAQHAMAAPFPA